LWPMNCNYFIPNVISHQACWLIGKIHMCLAESGALTATKRRAVEWVNKAKILPVFICIHIFPFQMQINSVKFELILCEPKLMLLNYHFIF
jgi:hypothetical protein